MNAARPHVLAFEDSEVDDLYDVLAHDGACLGEWEIFAPKAGRAVSTSTLRTQVAAEVCRECPVFAQCERLAALLQPDAGVWAGRLHTERNPEGVPI